MARERVAAARECLAGDGTMWLHLDHRAVHEAKLLCDRVFGRFAFLGEVIWAPGNGARGARRGPGMTHQTLLLYAGGRAFVWNAKDPALREPFAATSLSMHFTNDGARRPRATASAPSRGRTYRYYADEGRALGSVWTDCPAMIANTPLRTRGHGLPDAEAAQAPRPHRACVQRAGRARGRSVLRLGDDARRRRGAGEAASSGSDIGELAVATTAEPARGRGRGV